MFKTQNDFSLHIEAIKQKHNLPTYTDAVLWFHENETDHEFDEIVKMLNKKITNHIKVEAEQSGMIKTTDVRLM
jgi:hypothetical protein